jgi:class 3 adenylate cyclase
MAATPLKRKLAAILAADAVGYSRLMAADEEGTMRLLAAHRAVIDGIIAFHEGRIVNTAGDSVLADFASPVQAVRSAVEIQDALRTRNDSLPEDQRLQFRIGVNLGDVMIKGDDLLGDGVNVAARLESVADPGGICVSSSIYDQIAGKLDLGFVDIGAQSLKNLDRPVRVYRIDRDGHGGGKRTASRSARGTHGKWVAVAASLAVSAALAWHFDLFQSLRLERESDRLVATVEQERVKAQLARARADAEAAARRADAEAAAAAEAKRALEKQRAAEVKARADAEFERARADAEMVWRKAAAAESTAAKRRHEEQRAAEERARAQADLARLRAETEAAKQKADAELAAAAEARRTAEASVKVATPPSTAAITSPLVASVASLRDGQWRAKISCPPFDSLPDRTITAVVSVSNDTVIIEQGEHDAPRSLSMRGVQDADGSLWLQGKGVTGMRAGARTYPAGFFAKPVGERYEGNGRLGKRQCALVMSRAS